ncbi:hypothetical protein EV702DRAFT_1049392 [Suillus placidus]|uniref:Uncharacterized protein n=1 Tax=Suillus placidus TaxID=48579 RepID=A0A9P6ZLP2_9AGAM|nr:hypothetical protein EV702DRAFT_1049392 [Suillus placidus]
MSTTSTITLRSHSSQFHNPKLGKNNSQGRSTCKEKVIEPYKQPSTRLAMSQGRKPATMGTSTSQATLHGADPNLTKPPIVGQHQVLRFVSQSNHETDCKVFQNITPADYNYITCKIEDCPARPRLEYNYNTHILIVEMPSPVHETKIKVIRKGMEHLGLILQNFIASNLLLSDTHTNLTIDGDLVKVIPDIVYISRADLLQRLRKRVEVFPDIILLFIAEIHEQVPYSPPKCLSKVWQKLQKEKNVHFYVTFFSNRTGLRSLNTPTEIEVGQHLCLTST